MTSAVFNMDKKYGKNGKNPEKKTIYQLVCSSTTWPFLVIGGLTYINIRGCDNIHYKLPSISRRPTGGLHRVCESGVMFSQPMGTKNIKTRTYTDFRYSDTTSFVKRTSALYVYWKTQLMILHSNRLQYVEINMLWSIHYQCAKWNGAPTSL